MALDVDRDWIRRAKSGESEAFRMIVEALQSEVYNVAYRMTFNRADADDLAQEVFLRVYRNLRFYDDALPFAPWVRRVMTNVALNFRKRHLLRRTQPLVEAATQDPEKQDVELIERALATLPDEYRLVIAYKYFEDMPVEQIAEAMRVPIGTVKTWLFRARELLRERLGSHYREQA